MLLTERPLCARLLFNCSVMSNSLPPCGLQHIRLPCPSLSPRVCSNSCPLSSDPIQPSHPQSSPSSAFNLSHISCSSCIVRQIFYYCAIWESLLPCDFHLLGQCCMSTLYYKPTWGIDVDFSCIHWHHEPSGVLWKDKDRFLPGRSIWHQNYSWGNENWSSVKHWRKSMKPERDDSLFLIK